MYNQRGKIKDSSALESPIADAARKATGKLYKNPLDCLIQTVRAEGPLAVYKVSPILAHDSPQGFFAHLLRIAPHTILYPLHLESLTDVLLEH